jgi:hypothetical protein
MQSGRRQTVKSKILDGLAPTLRGIRQFASRRKTRKAEQKSPREPFHAVAIQVNGKSCDAARRIAGRRFLSGDAPRFPLPDCDQTSCGCGFRHFADRRGGPRRDRNDRRTSATERRKTRGRRAEDGRTNPGSAADYFHHGEDTQRLPRLPAGMSLHTRPLFSLKLPT